MTRDILIEPRDPAMFRDGRPFNAGLSAKSIAWPMPQAVAGHIRTRLWQPRAFVGAEFGKKEKDQLLKVRHVGPFLACEGENGHWELAFPAPADAAVYRKGRGSQLQIVPLRPLQEVDGSGCDLPNGMRPLWGAKPGKTAKDAPAFWTADQTLLWLGTTDAHTWFRSDAELGYATVPEQRRIHVQIREDRRNAQDEMLFRTASREFDFSSEFRRREDEPRQRVSRRSAIYSRIEGEGFKWSDTSGAGAMGGERRLAMWSEATNLFPAPPGGEATGRAMELVRMQLATPAIFEGGWEPGWMKSGEPPGCPGLKLEMIAAAIPRYQAVSGFDMTAHGADRLRATRFVVQAGAVYFFRVTEGDARQMWMKAVSDLEQDRLDGFGIVLTGGWQWR